MYHTTMSHQLIFINLQSLCQSQYNYYHPSPHVAPVAPQVIPSPLKGRKRQRNAAGQGGGGGKRQWVPAPIVAAPTSAICGVGPTIPAVFTARNAVK